MPGPNTRPLRRYLVLLCLLRDVADALAHLSSGSPLGPHVLPTQHASRRARPPAVPAGAAGAGAEEVVVHRGVRPSNCLLSAQVKLG